jgi:hypothetical protein
MQSLGLNGSTALITKASSGRGAHFAKNKYAHAHVSYSLDGVLMLCATPPK